VVVPPSAAECFRHGGSFDRGVQLRHHAPFCLPPPVERYLRLDDLQSGPQVLGAAGVAGLLGLSDEALVLRGLLVAALVPRFSQRGQGRVPVVRIESA
jgi:hypothetical protein